MITAIELEVRNRGKNRSHASCFRCLRQWQYARWVASIFNRINMYSESVLSLTLNEQTALTSNIQDNSTLSYSAVPASTPSPIANFITSATVQGLADQLKRLNDRQDQIEAELKHLSNICRPLAMQVLLDECVNGIGHALGVPPRESSDKATWDRDTVIDAWRVHLRSPATITDPAAAAYLNTTDTVRFMLGLDTGSQKLREASDVAALDIELFRSFCATENIAPGLRTHIERSFTYLHPKEPALMFKTDKPSSSPS
ncbi:hypothetical protein GGX14DRAFT_462654 [Mycena pura]|uniref:Uncharacterized protein n=1 Tax=Mycena pura TaxID=153505 RepID=A0AAD6Y5R0_9AGAR|nr:hypothetical protein GGX14DRAFT_462654 [Mycena pura]